MTDASSEPSPENFKAMGSPSGVSTKKSTHQLMLQLTGIDITRCPACKKGTLLFLSKLPACNLTPWDSS